MRAEQLSLDLMAFLFETNTQSGLRHKNDPLTFVLISLSLIFFRCMGWSSLEKQYMHVCDVLICDAHIDVHTMHALLPFSAILSISLYC